MICNQKKLRATLYYLHEQQTPHPTHHNTVHQANAAGNAFVGLLVIILPSMIILGVFLYKKYRVAVRTQQIEALEKLWLVSCKKRE